MKVKIWDNREFDFDDIENEEDIKKMSDEELRDWRKNIIDSRESYDDMDDWGLVLDEVLSAVENEIQRRKEMDDLQYVNQYVSSDDKSEFMAGLLMDDSNSTYSMFEEMYQSYSEGNEDYREGFNRACSILTGDFIETIAKKMRS